MDKWSRKLTFLRPSKHLRQLAILHALASSPQLSQRKLADQVGLSPSVVNAYLDRFLQQGLIEKQPVNARDFLYRLTSDGESHLSEMMVRYLRETFLLFSQGKEELVRHLAELRERHRFRKIALYSAGEVTELVIHALADLPLELMAIVDDDPNKQGQTMFGYPVVAPQGLPDLAVDAVIVTTFRYRQTIMDKLRELRLPGVQVLGL